MTTSTIGSLCLFDYNACNTCPTGSISVGRSTSSCGTCSISSTGFQNAKYVYRGIGLLNNSPGYIISDRSIAQNFIITSGLGFNSVLNGLTFDNVWPVGSNIVLCVISLNEMGGLFGFYNYSINTNTNTISITPSTNSVTRQDIYNSPITFNINSNGIITWSTYTFIKEN
jgi:hypothetical protein